MKNSRQRIVVVGSLNVDFVARAPRIPVAGETVTGAGFQVFEGGKGGNQAVAAARLGARTAMVARVGADGFGSRLKRSLRRAGVDTRAVATTRSASTGTAFIITGARGANQIVVAPGANVKLTVGDINRNRKLIASASLILAQLEIPSVPVARLAELAEKSGVPLILDPAPARKLPASLLRRVSILTPNETEACFLTGRRPGPLTLGAGKQLCRKLLSMGPRVVILKIGEKGALVAEYGREIVHVPAFRAKAVDTTAAGDAFNGALAAALLEDLGLAEAVRFACAAAALSVTKHGAQPSMPSRRAVEAMLRGQRNSFGQPSPGTKPRQG